ncbi:MAG: response regulator, partial [Chitinophagaceae bacterium]
MIFYADDDHDDISFFKDVASELDIPVTVFNAGSHLLEKLNAPPPAPTIIFLDINMPGHSGIEILKTIRKSDQWRNVPVIMLSTSSNLQDINTSYEYGATYYLPKVGNYGKL